MNNNQILKLVNYICVKENSGSTLKPDQINTIFSASNTNMFNRKVQEAQVLAYQNNKPFIQSVYEHMALREFCVSQNITLSSGTYNLVSLTYNYGYWLSAVTLYNGAWREIEILTDKELINRRTNQMAKQLNEYPGAEIMGNTLRVLPSDISAVEFKYLKNPATPVFDYYLDANYNLIYLTVGATHLLTTGETGSEGQTSGTTVTSASVEIEWNLLFHVEFCNEVLSKVGVNLKDVQLQQYVREVEAKQP